MQEELQDPDSIIESGVDIMDSAFESEDTAMPGPSSGPSVGPSSGPMIGDEEIATVSSVLRKLLPVTGVNWALRAESCK